MQTEKRVFSKLFKDDELKDKSTKLSVVSELITEFPVLEEAYQDAAYFAYDMGDKVLSAWESFQREYNIDDFVVNGAARNLIETSDRMRVLLEDVEQFSEQLGIDPREVYQGYDDAKYFVDNAASMQRDYVEKYREIISYVGFNDLM